MVRRRKKNDKMAVGFAAGSLIPVFIFLSIYLVRYPEIRLFEYLKNLWDFDVLLRIVSLCVFPNLLIFLLYIRRKMDYTARGVLAATFIYAFLVFASKII
jgi:hypothetical protein